jgi:hypothetical protein
MAEKRNKFHNQKERSAVVDFLNNHIQGAIRAADLDQFTPNEIKWLKEPTDNAMEVDVDHKYFTVGVKVSESWVLGKYREKKYENIIMVICHEIAHVATSECDDKLVFISSSKERSYYFERLTEITGKWLHRYYWHRYMPMNKINPATGK